MPNADIPTIFLAALESMAKTPPTNDAFPAAEINSLGRNLGLADTDTLHLVSQLDAEGRIKVEWGGAVKLLPSKVSKSIRLGKGAVYLGEGAQVGPGTAIGHNAMAAGATRGAAFAPDAQAHAIAELAAAVTLLSQFIVTNHAEVNTELKELIQQTQAILPELRSGAASKNRFKERLDETGKTLDLIWLC